MLTTLAAIAAALAMIGLVFANLPRTDDHWGTRWQTLTVLGLRHVPVIALFGSVALFALALPATPPFSAGLDLGWGALIGGLLGAYALLESAGKVDDDRWQARYLGLAAASALGPALVLLIFRGYPNDALLGCALGGLFVGCAGSALIRPRTSEPSDAPRMAEGVQVYALLTTLAATGAWLGAAHYPRSSPQATAGGYWAFPVLITAAGIAAAFLLSGRYRPHLRPHMPLLTGLAAAILPVAATAALQFRLLPDLSWTLPLYGLLAFALVLIPLLLEERAAPADEPFRPSALAFAVVLASVALIAVAFQQLQGYGIALAALPAALLASALYLGRDRQTLTGPLAMAAAGLLTLLLLFRVLQEQLGRGFILDFQQHYDVISVLLGFGATFGAMAFAPAGPTRPWTTITRAVLLGLLLALVPVGLTVLWGGKGISAFIIGLAIGQAAWIMLAAWTTGPDRQAVLGATPQIFVIAAALIASIVAPVMLVMEFTRVQKVTVVAALTIIAGLWVLVDALIRVWNARKEQLTCDAFVSSTTSPSSR